MKLALAMIAVLLPLAASSEEQVFHNQTTTVRLTEAPCAMEPMLTKLALKDGNPIQRAVVLYKGRSIEACWTLAKLESGEFKVLLVDADGDAGYINVNSFKSDPGI